MLGVRFDMPAGFDRLIWQGRGPHESYPDKKTGELKTMLSLEIEERAPIATNSPTVQQSFKDIIEIYRATGNENPFPFTVEVFTKKANASGRPYLNIRLVDED